MERCQGSGLHGLRPDRHAYRDHLNNTGLPAATSYSYRVRATDAAGNLSGYSNTATATTPAPPDTHPADGARGPDRDGGEPEPGQSGVDGCDRQRRRHRLPGGTLPGRGCTAFAQIASVTTTTYSNTGLAAATSYSYRVRATDAAGNFSGYSNTATATTPAPPDTTPPTAPAGLTAMAASPSQVNLAWTAATDTVGVTGYLVERCQGSGCTAFAQIASVTTTTYSNTGLAAATSYSYRVRATDAAGNFSGYSNTATATTPAPPDTTPPTAPAGLTAMAASPSQVNLAWTAATDTVGVTGYLVERCQGSGCTAFAQVASVAGTAYGDAGLAPATSYRYRVRAMDAAGNLSGYSNTATATTPAPPDTTPPTAPAGLTATAANKSRINLAWTASTDNVGVTGYLVERCQGSGCTAFAQIASVAGTTYSDTSLSPATSYSYRIRATDAAGNFSGYSNTATAATRP